MPYYKVKLSTLELLSGDMPFPPHELQGLAASSLLDLGSALPDNPGYSDIGYWPEVRTDVPFDPATHQLANVFDISIDASSKLVNVRQLTEAIPASSLTIRKRYELGAALAATDLAFKPRWAEDIASGTSPMPKSYLDWVTLRVDLRTQLRNLG